MKHISRNGFTLIELLVVATVVSVLMAAGVVSYTKATVRSRDAKRISDVEQIRSALEMYRADNGNYPSAGSGSYIDISNSGFTSPMSSYLPVPPTDPKSSQAYYYIATNPSGSPTAYYGYCLSANLEGTGGTTPCTAYTGYNYSAKNP